MADPDWRNGAYAVHGVRPQRGVSVARAAARLAGMPQSEIRARVERARQTERFALDAPDANGAFADRFDANSYLYLSRAMDGFDLAGDFGGRLANAFQGGATKHAVFSFSSDWRYPPEESRAIARALIAAGAETAYVEIETEAGHDAYLGDEPAFEAALTGFIDAAAAERGLALHGGGD
jgi:homoserine O-acetyltransferase